MSSEYCPGFLHSKMHLEERKLSGNEAACTDVLLVLDSSGAVMSCSTPYI